MSEVPPGGSGPPPPPYPPPPSEPPPAEPPPYFPPTTPTVAPPEAPAPGYWAPLPIAPPAPRRSGPNWVVILSIVLGVLVIAVLAGGYVVLGNSFASTRVSDADTAIAGVQKIDFTTTLFNISGGFGVMSATDAKGYQSKVNGFVQAITADQSAMTDDSTRLATARKRLDDTAWLTALNRSRLDGVAGRIDHAQTALSDGQSIASDLALDGQFFTAYATALVDFGAYVSNNTSGDSAGAISKEEETNADLTKVIPLASAPGLPSGVHAYLTDFQTVMTDIKAAINADFSGNDAAYNAAIAKLNTDGMTLQNFDTSAFDSAVQDFYQPRIDTYQKELLQASA